MNRMDYNTIFELFEEESFQVLDNAKTVEELQADPVLLIAIVNGVEEHRKMDYAYRTKFPGLYNDVRAKVKYKIYNRLYTNICRLELEELMPLKDIISVISEDRVFRALDNIINFYIELEEYEKCSIVQKLITLLNKIVKKEK